MRPNIGLDAAPHLCKTLAELKSLGMNQPVLFCITQNAANEIRDGAMSNAQSRTSQKPLDLLLWNKPQLVVITTLLTSKTVFSGIFRVGTEVYSKLPKMNGKNSVGILCKWKRQITTRPLYPALVMVGNAYQKDLESKIKH